MEATNITSDKLVLLVGEKEYALSRASIGTLRKLRHIEKNLNAIQNIEVLDSEEKAKEASDLWDEWCLLVFDNPDDTLAFDSLTFGEIGNIMSAFFGSAFGSQKPNA